VAPHTFDKELDARGLSCPMPLVKARQEVARLGQSQILRVVASDRGSVKDFQGWAKVAKDVELLAQETVSQDGKELYIHYVKKAG